jgi:glycosyltransferase involved in cell wall biosynthesis
MATPPLISVIIHYNKDRGFLKEAVASVEAQTINSSSYELILSHSPGGMGVNLNNGVRQAKGELIRYLCEDDRLTTNSLADSIAYMTLHPEVDFSHGKARLFGSMMGIFYPPIRTPTLADLINKNPINGGTVVYRRSCFDRFGMFDESEIEGGEYDFNMRLLKNGATIGFIDSILYEWRLHSGQLSRTNRTSYLARVEKMKDRFRK